MKILHILDHSIPLHSGYTFRTMSILLQQRTLGWDTVHLTSSKHNQAISTPVQDEYVEGLYFYRTNAKQKWWSKLPAINQLVIIRSLEKRIYEIVELERPDIIHAHSPALNGLAAVKAGKRLSIPVVYEIRAFWEDAAVDHGTSKEWGVRYRMTRAMETYVIRKAHAITTICEGLRKEIISRGIADSKVTVIPNAVDIDKFELSQGKDASLQAELRLTNTTVLGFIGSFYAYEGLSLLLLALPDILKQCKNIKVLLVGGGPEENRLKSLVNELRLSDVVVFTGRVPHTQVQRYYDLIDIFVYPRLSMRLTDLVTPLKPLEAMASGRLVLASDVGGHRELISSGKNGYLFQAGNALDLATKVTQLIENQHNWKDIKINGRKYVETERNWVVSVARYQSVYRSLLGLE